MAVSSRLSIRLPSSLQRTRIKICGITRPEDARAAVDLGADALGLVFYAPSPRCVTVEQAWEIARIVPPFVTLAGLFVNESKLTVRRVMEAVPIQLLQFHGEEEESFCRSFHAPYIKAARVRTGLDLVNTQIPTQLRKDCCSTPTSRATAAPANPSIGRSFRRTCPCRSSCQVAWMPAMWPRQCAPCNPGRWTSAAGVEAAKGIKDAGEMAAFISGVRDGEAGSTL